MIDVKPSIPMGKRKRNQDDQDAQGYSSKRIFVGGLPHDLRDEEFKNYFEKFGKITDWVVMHDRESNMPRGFGFITFDSAEAVEDVLRKRYHELKYKSVEVKRAHPKKRNNMLINPYVCYNQYNPYCISYGAPYAYGYGMEYRSENNTPNFGQYKLYNTPYCMNYGADYGYGYSVAEYKPESNIRNLGQYNPSCMNYGADYGYGYSEGSVFVPNGNYKSQKTPVSDAVDNGVRSGEVVSSSKSTRTSRNWMELPDDVTLLIFSHFGAIDMLDIVQKVSMSWRRICKNPIMWQTIDMRNTGITGTFFNSKIEEMCRYSLSRTYFNSKMEIMCRYAVDRSFGNLVDINVENFGTDELLEYITNSSPRIKRLRLEFAYRITAPGLVEAVSKLPLLEDLELARSPNMYSPQTLEVIGRSCPLLTTFKFHEIYEGLYKRTDIDGYALAVGETMPGLHHLQLSVTTSGLRTILDCCPHLESLDLRSCSGLDLGVDLRIRCNQIKRLHLPKGLSSW